VKRWLMVVVLVAAAGAALYYSERQKTESHVGPEAVLNAAAGVQRELSRVPARVVRLSDREEAEIGDSMARNYAGRSQGATEEDAAIGKYVTDTGRVVAAGARRKLNYRFYYIPDAGFINAFALPGGHIFVGKGLLHLMKTEDELAAVLGHEVEHVDHYHCNERVAIEARLRHLPLSGLVALPIELFQAGYSKEQELEADRDGTALAVMAGYSPQGAVHMFEAFDQLYKRVESKPGSPDEELSRLALETLTGYFRSHPLPQERIQQIQALIASQKWPQPEEKILKLKF
jgi:predicted Zn-dependent protease